MIETMIGLASFTYVTVTIGFIVHLVRKDKEKSRAIRRLFNRVQALEFNQKKNGEM